MTSLDIDVSWCMSESLARMCNPQSYVSDKRPMVVFVVSCCRYKNYQCQIPIFCAVCVITHSLSRSYSRCHGAKNVQNCFHLVVSYDNYMLPTSILWVSFTWREPKLSFQINQIAFWSSPLIHTVALKGHHYISFSLHYINFYLCEKTLCDYVYIIILHVYIILLHV